ncbi:lambda phage CII family protein [Phytobacter diazotrophicus]|uniref:CII family transcriptional regulator n=1 Tax=Phytobacter diazotrophicus TaxID=395631 RepID=UPI001C999A12|nr:CII family transcriptional regulator [Phytobacter diazotrophicus]MBY6259103.1 lambda phage CII family protein [Phytobacter diazotrophicus]
MENSIARKLEPPILNPLEIESTLLNRLASIGQKNYAERIGVSESTVSKRKADSHFSEIARELSALELQVVPPEAVVVSRDYLKSVETLADIGLRAERCRPGPLGWD